MDRHILEYKKAPVIHPTNSMHWDCNSMVNHTEALLSAFAGVKIFESPYITKHIPHPMATTRILAKIVGGKWWPKTIEVPSDKIIQTKDGMYMHPIVAAELRKQLPSKFMNIRPHGIDDGVII